MLHKLPFIVWTIIAVFFFSDNLCFSLFVGMIMYANEVETKKEKKLPEIKN